MYRTFADLVLLWSLQLPGANKKDPWKKAVIKKSTSDLKALIVDDPLSVSVNDAYIGERETLSSLRNSLDVDL